MVSNCKWSRWHSRMAATHVPPNVNINVFLLSHLYAVWESGKSPRSTTNDRVALFIANSEVQLGNIVDDLVFLLG